MTPDEIDYCCDLKIKLRALEAFQGNIMAEARRLGEVMAGEPELQLPQAAIMDAAGACIARLRQERDDARRVAIHETRNGALSGCNQ